MSRLLAMLPPLLLATSSIAQDSLVAHWPFDEVEGVVTPDVSGSGHEAVVTSAELVKGVVGKAIRFDGRVSGVRCDSPVNLELSDQLTLEAWVNPSARPSGGFPAVIRRDGAYALRFSEGRLGFLLWFDGKVTSVVSRQTEWEPGRWYHVAGIYDGAEMRLFIDGQLDPYSPIPHTGQVDPSITAAGIGSCLGRYAFDGVIDEVKVYTRGLTEAEVAASHQAGLDSLAAQANVTVEPTFIGKKREVFRKPVRDITTVQDGFLWVDAEDFTEYGGWLLDTQFVHIMGSAYLIAAGVGEPVADATVTVNVPASGTFRVWVRSKNWLTAGSPGKFCVSVGGTLSGKVCGATDAEAWVWEAVGDYELPAGDTQIALHDETGYYGRCDALILTTDLDYTPPAEAEAIHTERARLTGLSLEPTEAGEWDVIVVGAGAAGSCAALASARMGAKTALIQNRPVLGGNSSVELGVPINGAGSLHPNARETGVVEEVGRIRARYGFPKMSAAFQKAAEDEADLSVFLNQHVFGVEMAGDSRIAAVKAVDTLRNTVTVYRAKAFLDCTGDGWVGYYAGAEYRLGREARGEFDEDLAPAVADKITMSGCLMGDLALSFRSTDTGEPAPYTPPAWVPTLPPHEEFGRSIRSVSGGEWWLEHPGDIDDLWDPERARDELILVSMAYWDHIKNAWDQRARADRYKLSFIPITLAKRESRRLIGDYILNQNDVLSARVFEDRISYGGWPLDIHHPEGIFSGPDGPFDYNAHVPIYTIPFRCLYSKNIDNLLFAGRDMSVSHVALGTVRVQGTLSACGQAAGTAAAMCVERGITPRDLGRDHITLLQQTLLKNDQSIPEVANEDPDDLARSATVICSSYQEFQEFAVEDFQDEGELHPLNMSRGVMFPRGERTRLDSLHLRLRSENADPTPVTLHLREGAEAGDFSPAEDLLTVTTTVEGDAESWVSFPIGRDIDAPYIIAWLERAEGISWRLMSAAPLGSCRAYGSGTDNVWTVVEGQYYGFHTDPPVAIRANYEPENLNNGIARIVGESPNMWASSARETLPQWIELSWPEPQSIGAVYLTFDTDLNASWHNVPLPRQTVRDYTLAYHDGERWVTLVEEQSNFQRRRVHRFDAVATTRLRLTVHATNGVKHARVYEIRAYSE